MPTAQKRIQFAEENIEEISDLYNAISKIPWVPSFRMPAFNVFVESFISMMIPLKQGETDASAIVTDWLDFEADRVQDPIEDDHEKKM